ncbi:MAG TPA: HAMP domain-containing sensor histidine kinase [Anaerolineales bacterium]|nr:HAMP domain-containing sensor histidine kinase [Anaerolineales bacterium]
MFQSLRARLLLTYLLLAFLVLGLVGASLIFFLVRDPVIQRRAVQRLQTVAETVVAREADALREGPPSRLAGTFSRLDQFAGARAILVGPDGEVLVDSRSDTEAPPLNVLKRVGRAASGRYRDSSRVIWLYVAQPLSSTRTLMLTSVQPTVIPWAVIQEDFAAPLIRAGVVALLLSPLLAWLIARWVAGPLQRMAVAARAVADGEYQHQLPTQGPTEVQALSAAFNEMIRRVKASQQAQRDFVANVSHELKTPLTSIQGFAQAILDQTAGTRQAQVRAAGVILDETHRLHNLVDDLLDLARFDAGQIAIELKPMDIGEMLQAASDRLSLRAEEKQIKLVRNLAPMPNVVADGDRLAQVFTNLLDNAIRHTPAGGSVGLTAQEASGWVTIHIEDTGPGIPAEALSRIFERFFQLDQARRGGKERGAGLGLAISREIVAAHAGSLTAKSVVGRGSRFTVRLPVVRPTDETVDRKR